MSNQFSYELDERQIKVLLQDEETSYDETAWQRFESSAYAESPSVFSNVSMPKIDVGISRSFLIPIVFVSLIGGLSVLLFSFVDFKKNDEPIIEKALIPNANNVNLTPKKVIVATPKPNVAIKTTTINTVQSVVATTVSAIADAKPNASNTITTTAAKVIPTQSVTLANNTSVTTPTIAPIKKKKRKKETYEELPIISSQTISEPATEPDLELK